MILMNYLQGRNRDAEVENGFLDTVREGMSGMNEESSINICTPLGIRLIAGVAQGAQTGAL